MSDTYIVFKNPIHAALKLNDVFPKFRLSSDLSDGGSTAEYSGELMKAIIADTIEVEVFDPSPKLQKTLTEKYGFAVGSSEDFDNVFLIAPWNVTPDYVLGSIDGEGVTLTRNDIADRLLIGHFTSFYVEDSELAREMCKEFDVEEFTIAGVEMLRLL